MEWGLTVIKYSPLESDSEVYIAVYAYSNLRFSFKEITLLTVNKSFNLFNNYSIRYFYVFIVGFSDAEYVK